MTNTAPFAGPFVIFAGLIHPAWVRSRRAFGWAIVLLIALALLSSARWEVLWPQVQPSGEWFIVLAAIELLVGVASVLTLLRAVWPGSRLFSMGAQAANEA